MIMQLSRISLLTALIAISMATASTAQADGEALYATYCEVCHGSEGKGDGPGVPESMLKPRPFSADAFKFDTDADWQKGSDADLANVIRHGTGAYGGSPLMPAWPSLTDAEVVELVAYIRVLQKR